MIYKCKPIRNCFIHLCNFYAFCYNYKKYFNVQQNCTTSQLKNTHLDIII